MTNLCRNGVEILLCEREGSRLEMECRLEEVLRGGLEDAKERI